MTARITITGVDGFVGRHLAKEAAESGLEVVGISRSRTIDRTLSGHLSTYITADLRHAWPTLAPTDAPVIHLAGLAAVGPSFDRPQQYLSDNSAMVTHMCEAVLTQGSDSARIVGVSTGAVYAQRDDEPARVESDPVAFTSPYVVSKVLIENQLAYYRQRGMETVVARPFNHVGPGQHPGFLVPDLIERLSTLRPGEALAVGNLDTRRDYTDVRDVVRAYLALATSPALRHGLYNVASGHAHSGREILETICAALERPVPELRTDPSRIRATDPPIIVGVSARIAADVGWRAEIPLATTISDAVAGAGSP